jgi:hypothetical protein
MTQWKLIWQVVSHPEFIEVAGLMFTEYGGRNFQGELDALMGTPDLVSGEVEARVVHLVRDTGIWPLNPNTNFHLFLMRLHGLNSELPPGRGVRLVFSDIAVDWKAMTPEAYRQLREGDARHRDRLMAERIIEVFGQMQRADPSRRKALVIMNYRHAWRNIERMEATAQILSEAFPGRVANVLLNNAVSSRGGFQRIHGGAWDEAFQRAGYPWVGFDFQGSPFGADAFDQMPHRTWLAERHTYQDVFTGFIFHERLENHRTGEGYPGMMDGFEQELLRRAAMVGEDYERRVRENFIPLIRQNPQMIEAPYH